MRSSSGTGFGTWLLLFVLSAIGGAAVTLFLIISLGPLVALFPPTSGAQEIAYGIAVMWGLVVAATIAVLSIGSYRRRGQTPDFYGAHWQERYVPTAAVHTASATPRALSAAAVTPLRPAAARPQLRPAPMPAQRLRAYR